MYVFKLKENVWRCNVIRLCQYVFSFPILACFRELIQKKIDPKIFRITDLAAAISSNILIQQKYLILIK